MSNTNKIISSTFSENAPDLSLFSKAEIEKHYYDVHLFKMLNIPTPYLSERNYTPCVTYSSTATTQSEASNLVELPNNINACSPTEVVPLTRGSPHVSNTIAPPMVRGLNQAKKEMRIQNCISNVSLGYELKLLDIYVRTRFSEYNPSRFSGLVMTLLEPRSTALVFKCGKVVVTGARNEHDSYIAARKFARIIQKLGVPAKFLNFKIKNFIATVDLKFPVRLEALYYRHAQFSVYEPEVFPGLVYRMVRPKVVLLVFVNGKVVFTGGTSIRELNEALDIMYPVLYNYKKI